MLTLSFLSKGTNNPPPADLLVKIASALILKPPFSPGSKVWTVTEYPS
jgi:hypothetical protein